MKWLLSILSFCLTLAVCEAQSVRHVARRMALLEAASGGGGIITDGLIYNWPFKDNVTLTDAIGGQTLVANGAASIGASGADLPSGNSNYFNKDGFTPATSNSFSVVLSVSDAQMSGSSLYLAGWAANVSVPPPSNRMWLLLYNTASNLVVSISGSSVATDGAYDLSGLHTLGWSYSGGDISTVTIYVDGAAVAQTVIGSGTPGDSSGVGLVLGDYTSKSFGLGSCVYEQMLVYDKALSQSEFEQTHVALTE